MEICINKKNGKRYVVMAEGIDCTNVRDEIGRASCRERV